MADTTLIKTVFVGIILVTVLGFVVATILPNMAAEIDYSASADNDNTSLTVRLYNGVVENATSTVTYDLDATTDVTIKLNSTTLFAGQLNGTGTVENDVTSLITDGTNTLTVSVDPDENINDMDTSLEATVESDVVGAQEGINTYGSVIVTIIFIGFFVAGVAALLRYLGAV